MLGLCLDWVRGVACSRLGYAADKGARLITTAKKPDLPAPFPWFGGKSRVAPIVWDRFGEVKNYVEPFFGSGAVLLGRPHPPNIETINDADGFVCNFWRAIKSDPETVASYADWPVNESDLHARHIWLVNQRADLTDRLCGNPDWCDAKVAGYWVWGICAWIGSGWCSGGGAWNTDGERITKDTGRGAQRQLPFLGNAGRGVHRKLPFLGNAGQGVHRQRPHIAGQGVHRQRPHLADAGQGVHPWFAALSNRLRRVRVCCGDWSRVVTPAVTYRHGLTGVFLDPPYAVDDRDDCYAIESKTIAHNVREWAIANGDNQLFRIALCGYEGEHAMPDSWECVHWKAHGGFGNSRKNGTNKNCYRERIWFSPHCLKQSNLLESHR